MLNLFQNHLLTPLNGLNNNNYLINYYNNKYVLRIPNKNNIDFAHENIILNLVNSKFITPSIIYHNKESGILLSKYIENSQIDEKTPDNINFMRELTKTLKTLHNLKCERLFDPINEIKINISKLKEINYNFIVNIDLIINKLDEISLRVKEDVILGLCHNDLNPSNILYSNHKVYLIDFEYSCMCDIYFDLATFCWLLTDTQKNMFIENYFGYTSNTIKNKLNDYLFIVKLNNAIWSINKHLYETNKLYDYKLSSEIILKELCT